MEKMNELFKIDEILSFFLDTNRIFVNVEMTEILFEMNWKNLKGLNFLFLRTDCNVKIEVVMW